MLFIKKYRKHLAALSIAAVLAAVLLLALLTGREAPVFIEYNVFTEALGDGQIADVRVDAGPTLRFTFHDSDGVYITNNPRRTDLKEALLVAGVSVTEAPAGVDFIALGITAALVGIIVFAVTRRNGAPKDKTGLRPVTLGVDAAAETARKPCGFDDIAGNLEAKESVADIIEYLRTPERFIRYGARMPRGILLHGKPGTGKTLMARAMAGEAGVPFYAVSGSDFVQMYVGVGAARVRDLFKQAREHGRGVIFIDEIDALGKKRGDGIHGNDEREQTLNALLTEMQGFSADTAVVVVAATNRVDTLDEALLRPGRFDRRVEVGLPDVNARRQILALHARNKPLDAAVDLEKLARDTVFFSGAMLEGLLNDAAISAARRAAYSSDEAIQEADVTAAYYTALAGTPKKDRSALREKDREITAYHEAGHALAAMLCAPENRVAKLTIIPSSGGAGGFCVALPPERMYHTKVELEAQIITALAGRAAEEVRFGAANITTGAANDIEKATDAITAYITQYGFGSDIVNHARLEDKQTVARQCEALAKRLYARARILMEQNSAALEALAARLLEKETLDGEEAAAIVQPLAVCPPPPRGLAS